MFRLALAHLLTKKKQTFLTLAGIVLGSTSFVAISGFFLGLQGFLVEQLLNSSGHITVSAKETYVNAQSIEGALYNNADLFLVWKKQPSGRRDRLFIDNPTFWYELLSQNDGVLGYAPQLSTEVVITQGSNHISSRLIGIKPRLQEKVTNLASHIESGKLVDLDYGVNRIILGIDLARRLGVDKDDTVLVNYGSGKQIPFKIVGLFKTGIRENDASQAYSSLSTVQLIQNMPGRVNKITAKFKNAYDASSYSKNWKTYTDDKVESWDEANASIFSVFKLQDSIRYFTILVILMVAGFGTYNTLNVIVNQKKKEIAILRSMGFEKTDIIFLFLSQGAFLGLLGGFIGLILGYYICLYLQTIPFGGGPMGSGNGFLNISFNPQIYIHAMILSLTSTTMASILPAHAAGKLTPIEIIRGSAT